MNDRFLKNYYKLPRASFAQALLQTLRRTGEEAAEPVSTMHTLRLRPIALGAASLLFALALMMAVSPAVRAQVQDLVGQVGGVLFTQSGDYPGGDEPVTTVETITLSLEEARASLPFPIDLPTWVPEGYIFPGNVSIPQFKDPSMTMVDIHWEAPKMAVLSMIIFDQNSAGTPSQFLIGPESAEEVLVNGEPAALVRGAWNNDTKQWTGEHHLTLYWQHNQQTYSLSAIDDYISVKDLIRIAESIQ